MNKATELLNLIAESNTRKMGIEDGKRVIKKETAKKDCKPGYKYCPEKKQCIKMSLSEQRNRSIASTKSANSSSTKRNQKISRTRRAALIKD